MSGRIEPSKSGGMKAKLTPWESNQHANVNAPLIRPKYISAEMSPEPCSARTLNVERTSNNPAETNLKYHKLINS